MSYHTWGTIRDKIERELCIEDEDWIDEEELLGYANDAIRDCEACIHGLYEDYFLDYAPITFVAGTSAYDLPNNIYAQKVRRFLFENGAQRYVISRLKDWKKFEEMSVNDYLGGALRYQYLIASPTAGQESQIIMTPTIRSADSGAFGKLWYIRNANQLTTSSDVCDVPEFVNFIYAHIRANVRAKEGHPNTAYEMDRLERERLLMEGVLSNMVPDADTEIEPDLDWYEEMN